MELLSPSKSALEHEIAEQMNEDCSKDYDNRDMTVLCASPQFFSPDLVLKETRRRSVGAIGSKRRRSLEFDEQKKVDDASTTATKKVSILLKNSTDDDDCDDVEEKVVVVKHKSILKCLPPIDSPSLTNNKAQRQQSTTSIDIALHSLQLPESFLRYLNKKGIKKLYEWQSDALNMPGVLTHGQNIVYCAPTSGGKSLVADILLARRLQNNKGCVCMVVLPFVSLCLERARDLESIFSSIHRLRVLRHFGGSGGGIPKSGTGQTYLVVCTPEKANALVTKMIEQQRLKDLKCVVVDELHMVQEQGRGATLECLLTKLVYATEETGNGGGSLMNNVLLDGSQTSGGHESISPPSYGARNEAATKLNNTRPIQIVGMSATLPNVHALADWLDASCSESTFRPVQLKVFVKSRNDVIDSVSGEVIRKLDNGNDLLHVGKLCTETLMENGHVLVFCGTRGKCSSVAKALTQMKVDVNLGIGNSIEARTRFAHDSLSKNDKDGSLSEVAKCLIAGIAYHHAGLKDDERTAIETAYRKGLVRILCCTSTLAAGVNLPARRVIVRDLTVGQNQKLEARNLQQMIGRAGRAGLDDTGSAYVFVDAEVPEKLVKKKIEEVRELLDGPLPELKSSLASAGMRRVMLEGCASGLVKHAREVKRYTQKTLLSALNDFDDCVQSIAVDALRWLQGEDLLSWCRKTHTWAATPLGVAAAQSGMIRVESIRRVQQDLKLAREALVLATPLHLLFLITPTPDWTEKVTEKDGVVIEKVLLPPNPLPSLDQKDFMNLYSKLNHLQISVLEKVGIDRRYIETRIAQGKMDNPSNIQHIQQRLLCIRYMNAMILHDIVQEHPIVDICEKYKISHQWLKKLQDEAVRLGFTVSSCCWQLKWQDLGDLVNRSAEMLTVGGREDILPLTNIGDCIDVTRARALFDAGMKTPKELVSLGVIRVQKAIKHLKSVKNSAHVANAIFRAAEKFIAEEAKAAREEAEQRMRELREEEKLFCLEDDMITTNSSDTEDEDNETTTNIVKESKRDNKKQEEKIKREAQYMHDENEVDKTPGIVFCRDVESVAALVKKWRAAKKYAIVFEPDPMEPFTLPPIGVFLAFNDECVYFMRLRAKSRDGVDVIDGDEDDIKPACEISTAIEILRDEKSKKMTIDLKPQLRSLMSAETFEDRESRLKLSAMLPSSSSSSLRKDCVVNSLTHYFSFCGENVFDLRIMAWLLRSDVQTTPCVSSANAWGSSRMLRPSGGLNDSDISNRNKIILNSSSTSLQFYETSLCDAILRTFITDLSDTLNVSQIEKQSAYDPRAKMNRHRNKMSTIRLDLAKAVATIWHVSDSFEEMCKQNGVYGALLTLEMPFARVLADIENIGVPINASALKPQILRAKARKEEIEGICAQWISSPDSNAAAVNLNSSTDVSVLLFETLKLTPPEDAVIPDRGSKLKRRQRFRVDASCLEQLTHPIAALISEHRGLGKYIATSEELLMVASRALNSSSTNSIESEHDAFAAENTDDVKDRIYAFANQTDTETGRTTSVNPNLYSIPHAKTMMKPTVSKDGGSVSGVPTSLRKVFEAPKGRVLIACDYAQLELRLVAHCSEDPVLMDALSVNPFIPDTNGDPFTRISAQWMKIPYDEVTEEQRRRCKALVYGAIYGSGAKPFARTLNITEEEAMEMLNSFKSTIAGVEKWKEQTIRLEKLKDIPRARTLSGRFRNMPDLKSDNFTDVSAAERVFINTLMQGSSVDIIKKAALHALETLRKKSLLKKTDLILTIHDELLFECDEKIARLVGREAKKCMEDVGVFFDLKVPLFADLRLGKTWHDLVRVNTL